MHNSTYKYRILAIIVITSCILLILCNKSTTEPGSLNLTGITETNGLGKLIGNIDLDDWTDTEIPNINSYIGEKIKIKPLSINLKGSVLGQIYSEEIDIINFSNDIISISSATKNPFSCNPTEVEILPNTSIKITVNFTLPDTVNTYSGQLDISSSFMDSASINLHGNYQSPNTPSPGTDEKAHEINEYHLHPAYPNPATGLTAITFCLPQPSHFYLYVIDKNESVINTLCDTIASAGTHRVEWDLTNEKDNSLQPDIYRVLLSVGDLSLHGDIQVKE